MSVVERAEKNRVAVSVLSLMDASSTKAKALSLVRTFEAYSKMTEEAGLDGLQWHPLKFPVMAGVQVELGLVDTNAREKILVAEQSFRSEKNLWQVYKHQNPLVALSAFVTMEERVASMRALARLQDFLGRKLPVVLYPRKVLGEPSPRFFQSDIRLFQPNQAAINARGKRLYGSPFEALDQSRILWGFTGYALDLYHFRSGGGPLANWRESIPALAPLTGVVHVSLARTDQPDCQIDTRAELADLLNGTENTDMSKMIKAVRDTGWKGIYVIEVPPAELKIANPDRPIMDSLQQIGSNIRQILAS